MVEQGMHFDRAVMGLSRRLEGLPVRVVAIQVQGAAQGIGGRIGLAAGGRVESAQALAQPVMTPQAAQSP